ncbi:MAG: hypothetical protein HKN09_01395 [Saprospiraceae bacterium]|nr:hypothetical protein [Saprospiraceae bacterium]
MEKEGTEEFFYWELKDEKRLWDFDSGEIVALSQFRDSLKMELGSKKLKSAVHKESRQDLEPSLIAKAEDGDRINALLVHTGTIGKIRKINFLESQILNYQATRFPLFSKPTEFHGFIAVNEKEGIIRVYFGSSDTEWPPKPHVIIEELENEIKQGWKLKYHLHNHFCKKDSDYIGILAPSLADAQYYKMLKERFKVEKTLITNGFHTVEIDNDDFSKFESH